MRETFLSTLGMTVVHVFVSCARGRVCQPGSFFLEGFRKNRSLKLMEWVSRYNPSGPAVSLQ